MTVDELLARCDLIRASEEKLAACRPFSCGEGDLDEFFAKDCLVNQRKLLGKTYLFCLKDQPDTIVTAFSLSNDSIRLTNRITDEYKEQFLDDTDLCDKTLKRFPAVLIGRLGTSSDFDVAFVSEFDCAANLITFFRISKFSLQKVLTVPVITKSVIC
jgi:hypothetical protein